MTRFSNTPIGVPALASDTKVKVTGLAATILPASIKMCSARRSAFCANAATLPVDARSVLIRSTRGGFGGFSRGLPGGGFRLDLVSIAPEMAACAQ